MGRYKVLDLETTVRNVGDDLQGGGFAASPFHPVNEIVYAGVKNEHDDDVTIYPKFNPPELEDDIRLVVGHNIAFDLQYLLMGQNHRLGHLFPQYADWYQWFHSGGLIWDTMLAEYIISGQEHKWPSLDFCSEKYGGTLKDDKIKEYWKAGIATEDIPEDELKDYLAHDVQNTELVFLSQLDIAYQQNQVNLIMQMMEARMATIKMECNGTFFDKKEAEKEMTEIEGKILGFKNRLETLVEAELPHRVPLDVMSATQMSKFLLGGIHTYPRDITQYDSEGNVLRFKTGARKGQVKTKKGKAEVRLEIRVNPVDVGSTMGKNGTWKLDDDILKAIARARNIDPVTLEIVDLMRKIRKHQKDITAFYKPYIGMTWHTGLLHPSYQHTNTDTGRLSCVKPNMQQSSKKD